METNKRPTQADRILRYLEDYGSISQQEAINEFGCYRLGARIFELKKRGYKFTDRMVSGFNRYGEPIHFKRYELCK